ncbi:MAG: carboxypeptidase-like regulatory domain-containing protein [Planctomycetota bacterium]
MAVLTLVLTSGARASKAERYRTLTEALERGELAEAAELAAGFAPDSEWGRKAVFLAGLASFLNGDGLNGGRGAPAAPPGCGHGIAGAMRLALTRDGAFSAVLLPEHGVGGYRPLLFGWPEAWTSRLSLLVDGEAVMLSPHGWPQAAGNALWMTVREGELDVTIVLRADAKPPHASDVEPSATLRIEATVANRAAVAKTVGVRLLLDLADGFDDAPPVRLGERHVLATAIDFAGDQVPRVLGVGPRRLYLRGLPVGGTATGAIERMVLAPLPDALAGPFDFALAPGEPLGPDSALALYLEAARLEPGAARSLAVEFSGVEPGLDVTPPVATMAWMEAVTGHPEWTRVLLALENSARGMTGPLEDLRASLRLSPGLSLVEAARDLDALGTLAPGAVTQRAVIVAPSFRAGAPLEVSFDVSVRAGSSRAGRTVRVAVPPPASLALAGRILDVQGRPVPGADVVLRRDGRDIARTASDGWGNYRFNNVAAVPHQVLAWRVVHREPAAKAAREDVENLLYDIVLSSETIGNDGRPRLPEVLPGEGRDVWLAHSTTRYSVFVGVEWDAPRSYLEQIVRGMRRAAEFLYVASDGHLTYGRVVVKDAAQDWNHTDLYDWANNSVHPNASVNGTRHCYHPVWAPWNTAMNFGRQWAPTWDSIGLYSTVVHEFGHYGLGLLDEYLGAPQGQYRGLSYPEMCRCIMGYQYSDHKICWQGNHQGYTNQGMWNGVSCWQQIEAWHEGMRSGFYVPVTTPAERGGVVPPEFPCGIGEELQATIRDVDTGAFDAPLRLAGPFGSRLAGVHVYVDVVREGRTMYQGITYGDGSLGLVGVHVGDRVRGLKEGARAELTIGERRPSYTLEFDSEPAETRGPPPLVIVHPERVQGRAAGAAVEIVPLEELRARPAVVVRGVTARTIETESVLVDGKPRYVALVGEKEMPSGRLLLESVLPDAVRGDMTLVTDTVIVGVGPDREAEFASFDGSVRVYLPEGCLGESAIFACASTAGPSVVTEEAISRGRLHAIMPFGDENPLRSTALLVFRVDEASDRDRLEVRRYDLARRLFVPLPPLASARPDEIVAELFEPGVVGLFERTR